MKTGTATIDINEYDRLMKVERDLDLTVNTIKETNLALMRSVIMILELNQQHLRDIELGITNAGYAWEYNSPHGQIRLGKGSKLIKLSE
jgi:hypothetical protein